MARRGQLRRARVAVSRSAHRDLRPPRDVVVLSRAPHHHRRGRHGRHRTTRSWPGSLAPSATGAATATAPAARTTPAASASRSSSGACLTATTTSTSTATWATTSRRRTCRRRSAVPSFAASTSSAPRAARTTRSFARRSRPYEDRLVLPRRACAHGPVVVLLRHHRARGRRVHAQRAHRVPRGQSRRDAQPLQRQPPAASRVRGHRLQGGRRPRGHRRDHGAHLLRGRVPGHRRAAAGVHGRRLRALHGRRASRGRRGRGDRPTPARR